MSGLFLTCTENSFFFWTHVFKQERICYLQNRWQLTWEGSPLFMVSNFPSTQVSCLKPTALAPLAFPSPPTPTPRVQRIYFFICTKTTLTSLILLFGTGPFKCFESKLTWKDLRFKKSNICSTLYTPQHHLQYVHVSYHYSPCDWFTESRL